MATEMRPFFPIIYVRGYAMTPGEIAATVATPYMGFNLGSTKIRQSWDGSVHRHIFESPLVRLMKDYGYTDMYAEGIERSDRLPAKSIIIHRYYEQADKDLGTGERPTIIDAARALRDTIHRVRNQVCGDDETLREQFRVYLVAHSMGGLVCRCFLQNDDVSTEADRALVDKVFTYATPHNGIELGGINVPQFLDTWHINNFNRREMAGYLQLPADAARVDTLNGRFDPERFFCLIGTNASDYEAAGGWSSKLAGEMSDGLVRIDNAAVQGAPRAHVHRSHGGAYGIVNSEEGYQNLTRFLFGNVRVHGVLEVDALPLPPSIRKAHEEGREVRASYYFEASVAPRAATSYMLSERRRDTSSAILRKFDEMMRWQTGEDASPRWPVLFSVFLDRRRITKGETLVFSVELAVSTTDYTIDGFLIFDQKIPSEYLFRDTVTIRARPVGDDWNLRYVLSDEDWGEGRGRPAEQTDGGFIIPLRSRKGYRARLRLEPRHWR